MAGNIIYGHDQFPICEGVVLSDKYRHALCDIYLALCRVCGHLFNATRSDIEFLEYDYFKYYPSPTIHNSGMEKQLDDIFDLVTGLADFDAAATIFQDACQYGYLLSRFKLKGATVAGCEQNQSMGLAATEKGIKVYTAPLRDTPQDLRADIFISAHVLEHVDDVRDYLAKVASLIGKTGHAIIQVPNFSERAKNLGICQLLACHASYFSEDALRNAFGKSGFELLHLDEEKSSYTAIIKFTGNTDYQPLCRAEDNYQLAKFYAEREQSYITDVLNFLNQQQIYDKKIVFYGAGIVLTFLLYISDKLVGSQHQIVDGSEYKAGKPVTLSDTLITLPGNTDSPAPDVVIITSGLYHEEILAIVAQYYPAVPLVLRLLPVPELINVR